MKFISILRLIILSIMINSMHQIHCARATQYPLKNESNAQAVQTIATIAKVEEGNMGELAKTFAETQLIIEKATNLMNRAYDLLLSKGSTQEDDFKNVKIIIEQNQAIVIAQQKLEKMQNTVAKTVEEKIIPEGYWNKFVAGVKNIGSNIAALFSAGTGTEEEKTTARLIIQGLNEQEAKITKKYALEYNNLVTSAFMQQTNLTGPEQVQFRYNAIIKQIEATIYEQQIITGEKSSTIKRNLLLGAAGAAAILGGIMLKSKYFQEKTEKENEKEEFGKEEKEPQTTTPTPFDTNIIKEQKEDLEKQKEKLKMPTTWEKVKTGSKQITEKAIQSMGEERKKRQAPTIKEAVGTAKVAARAVGKAVEDANYHIKRKKYVEYYHRIAKKNADEARNNRKKEQKKLVSTTDAGKLYHQFRIEWHDCMKKNHIKSSDWDTASALCAHYHQEAQNALKALQETPEYAQFLPFLADEAYYDNISSGLHKILMAHRRGYLEASDTQQSRDAKLKEIIDENTLGDLANASDFTLGWSKDIHEDVERGQEELRKIVEKIEAPEEEYPIPEYQ